MSYNDKNKQGYSEKSYNKTNDGRGKKPYGDRDNKSYKPYGDRDNSKSYKPYGDRDNSKSYKPYGDRDNKSYKPYGDRDSSKSYKPYGDRDNSKSYKPYGDRDNKSYKPYGKKETFGKKPFDKGEKPFKKVMPKAEKPEYSNAVPVERAEEPLVENMLEGRNPIREALKAGRQIEKLFVAEGEIQGAVKEIVYNARVNGALIQEVERTRLDKMSLTGAHQGVIAYAAVKEYCQIEDILAYAKEKGEEPFVVVLDGICDPQNLGAIIRSAECAGVHGVIIPQRRAVGLTPVVAKCSAGAIEYMHIARVTNISQTLKKLKEAGLWVYGASMEGKGYSDVKLTGAAALVIGAEGEGLSRLVKDNCDALVSIPQTGHIDSLNASVAAGILIYDCVRQRNARKE